MLKQKKAAFEMSITTVVIIVIAMSMLILGLVLVRSIFKGATENVVSINQRVKEQIDKLFTSEDQEFALYLSNNIAEVKQGDQQGIAFGIRNIHPESVSVNYNVKGGTSNQRGCSGNAINWIVAGKTGNVNSLGSGDTYYGLIRLQIPRDAPVGCIFRYNIEYQAGNSRNSVPFDIKIKAK